MYKICDCACACVCVCAYNFNIKFIQFCLKTIAKPCLAPMCKASIFLDIIVFSSLFNEPVLLFNFMTFCRWLHGLWIPSWGRLVLQVWEIWPCRLYQHQQSNHVSWAVSVCDRVPAIHHHGAAACHRRFPWSGHCSEDLSHFVPSLSACQLGAKTVGKGHAVLLRVKASPFSSLSPNLLYFIIGTDKPYGLYAPSRLYFCCCCF